jgi:hypothetical protein
VARNRNRQPLNDRLVTHEPIPFTAHAETFDRGDRLGKGDVTAKRMTGSQSRLLNVGARVCWRDDNNDLGAVTEKNWAGVTVKWENRSQQSVSHNDMACVGMVSKK